MSKKTNQNCVSIFISSCVHESTNNINKTLILAQVNTGNYSGVLINSEV